MKSLKVDILTTSVPVVQEVSICISGSKPSLFPTRGVLLFDSVPFILEIDHGVGAAANYHGDGSMKSPQCPTEVGLLEALWRAVHHHRVSWHPTDRLRPIRHSVIRKDYDVHLEKNNDIRAVKYARAC